MEGKGGDNAGGKNTGPIGSSVNDDSKVVKARVDNKGKKVTS